jgi:excisionase family DNA binding protein
MAELLTIGQLAKELNVNPETLRRWRRRGEGPAFMEMGDKLIRYRREDISAWQEKKTVEPTP